MSYKAILASFATSIVLSLALQLPAMPSGEYRILNQHESEALSGGYTCTGTVACTACKPDTVCVPVFPGICSSGGGNSGCTAGTHPNCTGYNPLVPCAPCSCGGGFNKVTNGCFWLGGGCNPRWISNCVATNLLCDCDC